MILGIDGRSLLDLPFSGVGEYASNLLKTMIKSYPNDEFRIFLNRFHGKNGFSRRIPSKVLNIGFFARFFQMEKFLGKGVEHIFLPNHIFFSTKLPYTITVHDLSFYFFPEFYAKKGILWHKMAHAIELYKNAQKIIAVSKNTKEDLLRLGVPEKKIEVIYSGLNSDFLQFSCEAEKKSMCQRNYQLPKWYILYLGTVEKRKNILGILRAFEMIKKRKGYDELFLLIAGKAGFGFSEIRKKYEQHPYKKFIRFLGYVPHEAKPFIYHGASVFLYPSFYEGFGFPPLEAMAMGVPAIVSSASSLPEITRNAAIHIDPFHVNDLCDAVCLLLQDVHLSGIMIQRGKILAAEYTWEKSARKTMEYFKQ